MEDSVRSIFMTLIKIPCFIVISYIVFNIFAFSMIYFKMLGVSYMVSEVALENNYIPNTEKESLENYFAEIDGDYSVRETKPSGDYTWTYYRASNVGGRSTVDSITLIDNLHLVVNTDGTGSEPATEAENNNTKVQYGNPVRAGIAWDYYWIWPLLSVSPDGGTDDLGFYYNVNGYSSQGGTTGTNLMDANTNHSNRLSDAEIERRKNKSKHLLHCSISYVIPGMKYYPDLD